MLNAMKIDADRAMLLVIDFQTKLLPQIHENRSVLTAAGQLLHGAKMFSLPIVATEQYRRGLGPTHAYVAELFPTYGVKVLEKMTFSCCCDDAVRNCLNEVDRPQVIVTGIEAHVCVAQTVLDLLAMEYQVFVCADAVGSRKPRDYEFAIARMRDCGATITTAEALLFELCHVSGTSEFKQLLDLVKDPTQGREFSIPSSA